MTRRSWPMWLALVAAVVGVGGCGLKGALTQPEKASNIVIRGQEATAEPAAPEAPAPPAAEPPLPPPDLPHSNSGSPR